MLGGGVLGRDEAEHLDLVELVHAEDSARVLAGRAGLAAEARREPGIAQRQPLGFDHLAVVQRRQRDLGGADEVQLVLGHVVDLLLGVRQKAGPVQRAFAHEHRRDHRFEAVPAQLLKRPAHERQLEHHEVAFQVGKARARQVAPRDPCRSPRPRARGDRAAGTTARGARPRRAALRPRARAPRSDRAGSAAAQAPPRARSWTTRQLALELLGLSARPRAHRLDLALPLGSSSPP